MYLLYDVLQLRSSSLGNTLLVKRRNWKAAEDDIASLTVDQLEDAAKTVQRLNHARDEPGVGAIAREDFADGNFEAADQRFGLLTFVVAHIHSPRRAPGSRRSNSTSPQRHAHDIRHWFADSADLAMRVGAALHGFLRFTRALAGLWRVGSV